MQAQTVDRTIKLQGWAAQISAHMQSGISVEEWCREQGIGMKTYYRRRKTVREELPEAIKLNEAAGAAGAAGVAQLTGSESSCVLYGHGFAGNFEKGLSTARMKPVFAALPMPQAKPQAKGSTVTVRMGGYEVDIQNSADGTLVEQVLRVVAKL